MSSRSVREPLPGLGEPAAPGQDVAAQGEDPRPRWWSVPVIPAWAIRAATVLAAATVGRFVADGKLKYGLAIMVGGVLAPLVFFNLPFALAAWAAILYVKDLHVLSVGPNALGVLLGLAFIGAFIARAPTLPVLRQQRPLILICVLFLVWGTLSTAWAQKPGLAASESSYLWLGGLALLITMTILIRTHDIGVVAWAFVIGATGSAVIGLATGGIAAAAAQASSATSATMVHGRLTGGGGDPNLQAAGFVAAIFLVLGLFSIYRSRLARSALLICFALIMVAFVATESRGGLLALAVSTIVALAISRNQRRRILSMVMLGVLITGVALALTPGLLNRITDFGGGTSGRSDIWAIGVTVFEQHPLVGVGLANFPVVEPRYALMHRTITRVTYIAETPYPTHNTYLQMLDEEGVIGFMLFAAVIGMSLRCAWKATELFERTGRHDHAQLARATLMGTVGMLTAIFFFTDGDDWRLWILLGLGPALLALARQERPSNHLAV